MEEMGKTSSEEAKMGYVLISSYEAALLKRLRRFDYGTWTVVKTEGQPRRIVEGGSTMLEVGEADELFEN
jgi:hypothetical protein